MRRQFSRGPQTVSIGDEIIPMTMQAEFAHMTLDEAIASGTFDMPEEPGWVRIPVTIHVMIPGEMLEGVAGGENG
jgi:hypothetical protein